MNPASGTLLLEVCRGLWALQALNEKKAIQAIAMLDQTMKAELAKLEATLEARWSVAGEAAAGVKVMNQSQRLEFQTACGQQRQNLLTGIAWEFRQLLCLQQQILTKLQVPTFDGPTVDGGALDLQARVCSYLHSAFFLRIRVGEEPHVNMLKGHLKVLQKERDNASSSTQVQPPTAYTVPQPPNYGYNTVPMMGMQQQMPPPPPQYAGQQMPPMMTNQQLPPPPPPPPPPGPYGNQQYPPSPYYQ
jgi:hypothetical protein